MRRADTARGLRAHICHTASAPLAALRIEGHSALRRFGIAPLRYSLFLVECVCVSQRSRWPQPAMGPGPSSREGSIRTCMMCRYGIAVCMSLRVVFSASSSLAFFCVFFSLLSSLRLQQQQIVRAGLRWCTLRLVREHARTRVANIPRNTVSDSVRVHVFDRVYSWGVAGVVNKR